jgi:hypothetical protein
MHAAVPHDGPVRAFGVEDLQYADKVTGTKNPNSPSGFLAPADRKAP